MLKITDSLCWAPSESIWHLWATVSGSLFLVLKRNAQVLFLTEFAALDRVEEAETSGDGMQL